ncbi:MAG: DnaD domain protein [Lachnospiraceae bacterium]|nr:DnaD domain protein [Lachnospiraceae bacterium]
MKTITISTENSETYSSISNFFIDYYMTDANGEFVKVYLYLARLLGSNSKITVAEIADHFNLTEKDICRAIKYWISRDVLKLNYNGRGQLNGIVLLPLHNPANDLAGKETDITSFLRDDDESDISDDEDLNEQVSDDNEAIDSKKNENNKSVTKVIPMPNAKKVEEEDDGTPKKPKFSKSEMANLEGDDDWTDIIYQVETLFGRTVSSRDVQTLMYIYETLEFDVDLYEYLIEYCATLGKKNCRYLEAVAIAWYKEGITTRQEAKNQSYNVSDTSKIIFKALGIRSRVPTTVELSYIARWTGTLGFSDEMIKTACERAILSNPNSANFAYINAILENWHKNDAHTLADIERLDKEFNAKKKKSDNNGSAPAKPATAKSATAFNNFQQTNNDVPLEEMEKLFLKEVNDK